MEKWDTNSTSEQPFHRESHHNHEPYWQKKKNSAKVDNMLTSWVFQKQINQPVCLLGSLKNPPFHYLLAHWLSPLWCSYL